MTPAHILLVAPSSETADTAVHCLLCEAQKVKVVRDFDSAKAELDREPAALVVTELKLGAYNGIHLALRGRATRTPVIVLGTEDPVLELVAQENGIEYLRAPLQLTHLQALVRSLMGKHRERSEDLNRQTGPATCWPVDSSVPPGLRHEPAIPHRISIF